MHTIKQNTYNQIYNYCNYIFLCTVWHVHVSVCECVRVRAHPEHVQTNVYLIITKKFTLTHTINSNLLLKIKQ